VGLCVGVGVKVRVTVTVFVGVRVGVGVRVEVRVGVSVGAFVPVRVGVNDGVGVTEGVSVRVGVRVTVGVGVGVFVARTGVRYGTHGQLTAQSSTVRAISTQVPFQESVQQELPSWTVHTTRLAGLAIAPGYRMSGAAP